MRNWNAIKPLRRLKRSRVLIVPMRNWNKVQLLLPSYRVGVLIVPMRNWNWLGHISAVSGVSKFWSYLWGIETENCRTVVRALFWRFDRTYEELKPLPPRRTLFFRRGFDRTYEELKQTFGEKSTIVKLCFDRTYEELKLGTTRQAVRDRWLFWSYLWGIETFVWNVSSRKALQRFWSYLWGIETSLRRHAGSSAQPCVLIVPMRNWNVRAGLDAQKRSHVLIVPMRNWNQAFQSDIQGTLTVLIVPMRNWNTNRSSHFAKAAPCFDRTYEELKPLPPRRTLFFRRVLIVPMRNWNQVLVWNYGRYQVEVLIVPMRNWNPTEAG